MSLNTDEIEPAIRDMHFNGPSTMPGGIDLLCPNCTSVSFGAFEIWYSYKTPVAFRIGENWRVVSQNYWSSTTGRHLTLIDGGSKEAKKSRVDDATFNRLWNEQFGKVVPKGQVVPKIDSFMSRNLGLD
jgi:hypothetical protein